MRALLLICAGLLFLAIANLPIGYYTFLRIVVTIGAGLAAVHEYEDEINFWVIAFGLIAILFNPFVPVFLNEKALWMPIDFIVGVLFTVKSFTYKDKE